MGLALANIMFQCSSASRKFLNQEPGDGMGDSHSCFSALQRAENSSIFPRVPPESLVDSKFQCSSASRKFLNNKQYSSGIGSVFGFSALQRAENSSIVLCMSVAAHSTCFSALQRAENSSITVRVYKRLEGQECFSALQRAENSSMINANVHKNVATQFQCSSASRKFLNLYARS